MALHLTPGFPASFATTLRKVVCEQGHVIVEAEDDSVTCLISDQPEEFTSRPSLLLRVDPSGCEAVLGARLRALAAVLGELSHRSGGRESEATSLWLSGIEVDTARGLVHRDGNVIKLTPIELGILRRLALARGGLVTRQALEHDVWGYAAGIRSRTVFTTVHRLRSKIERNPHEPAHLLSTRTHGYALVVGDPPTARR